MLRTRQKFRSLKIEAKRIIEEAAPENPSAMHCSALYGRNRPRRPTLHSRSGDVARGLRQGKRHSMSRLCLREISFSYGGANLLEEVSLQIEPGERIGLLGRNGAGKSTLLKLLQGQLKPDSGEIDRAPGMIIARLIQEVLTGTNHTIFDEVAAGLGPQGVLLARMLTLTSASPAGPEVQRELDQLHQELDGESAWKQQRQIETTISRMGLDPAAMFDTLASGMKRRVLLAQTIVSNPDLLLLDEPANHLDLESIQWLEDFLLREARGLIFVTHDRVFLRRLAT